MPCVVDRLVCASSMPGNQNWAELVSRTMTSPFGRRREATMLIGIASTRDSGCVVEDDVEVRRSCCCDEPLLARFGAW